MRKWVSITISAFLIIGFASTALAADTDYDGIEDGSDNCPAVYNPNQEDTDYVLYKRFKVFSGATDTFTESGVSISESSGDFTGTNIEFVCDTCDVADFSGTTYPDIGTTSGLCTYTTSIIENIIDNDDQICGQSTNGFLYDIDIISSDDGTCYPDYSPENRFCISPINPGGDSSYVRDEITAEPDGIGDACDCGEDGVCTALTYCINQSTPDPDCTLPERQWDSGDPVEVALTGGSQTEPRIVRTTDDNYVITWQDYDISATIYAQKINGSTGAQMWGGNGIQITPISGNQPEEAIIDNYNYQLLTDNDASNTGGVFLAWDDDVTASDVYVQRLDTEGSPVSGWPSLPGGRHVYADNTAATTYEAGPHILEDGSGGIYVAWSIFDDTMDNALIHVTRLNSSGALHSSWNTGGTNDFKTVALDGDNPSYTTEYVISVEPYYNGANEGIYVSFVSRDYPDGEIYIAQLDDDGSPASTWNEGDSLLISDPLNEQITDPTAKTVPDGNGGIIVVYDYLDSSTGDKGIRAQKVNNAGGTQWPSGGGAGVAVIDDSLSYWMEKHFIASDDSGGVYVIASGGSGGNAEVLIRKVDTVGNLGTLTTITDSGDNIKPFMQISYGGSRIIPDGEGGAVFAYNSFFDSASDSGASYPALVLQKIDSEVDTQWGNSAGGDEYVVLSNELPMPGGIMFPSLWDANAALAEGSTAVAWQRYNNTMDGYHIYAQLLADQLNNPCGDIADDESCLSFDVYPGPLAFEYLPSTITFPHKFFTTIAQPSFSNDDSGTPGVDVSTGPEDVITVDDFSNSGGFELTLSASDMSQGPISIPIEDIYAATSYPSSSDLTTLDANLDGTASGGVVYAAGSFGTQDIVSSIHTDGNLNFASAYKVDGESFDYDGDGVMEPLSLMSTSTAHSGRFSQALSLYIEIPANQPEGDYDMALTFDVIAN